MNTKTRITALLAAVLLVFSLAACAGSADAPQTTAQPETASGQSPREELTDDTAQTAAEPAEGKVLVVYFSATGTTKGVAEKIAGITNAELYEIKPAQPYTDADLNWHDSGSRTTKEQNDKSARPEIAGEAISLNGYAAVFIGYPIWWGEEPRIMDTFAESHDFNGITVIPFCTSGGSGIGRSGKNLEEIANGGAWLNGARFGGGVSEAELQAWIETVL